MKNLVILAYYFELNCIRCESELANPYMNAILAMKNGEAKWERIQNAVTVHMFFEEGE